MHSENLYTGQTENFELQPNTRLFSDGGISPAGECWVLPTDIFLRVWKSPTGKHLKKQGFHLRNDGKRVGASQNRILYCPRHKLLD